jgi:hypothetical protein
MLVIKELLNRWDYWKEGHAIIENHVFDIIRMFFPNRIHEC